MARLQKAVREVFEPHKESAGELRELLAQTVSALPPDERELIAQKYFLRRSVREIAGAQQTTEKAVESKLSRVRRKLKDGVLGGL